MYSILILFETFNSDKFPIESMTIELFRVIKPESIQNKHF